MEVECTRCHRKFRPQKEDVTVCPQCLMSEFSTLPQRGMDRHPDTSEWRQEMRASERRQQARARRMLQDYASDAPFSTAGKLRFVFGCLVFLGGFFLYMLGSEEHYQTFVNALPVGGQVLLAWVIAVVAALLVLTSTRRYRLLTVPLGIVFLGGGYYLPLLTYRVPASQTLAEQVSPTEVEEAGSEGSEVSRESLFAQSEKRARMGVRVMDAAALQVLDLTRQSDPQEKHVAIYMDEQSMVIRDMFRDELTRLLQARKTHAYAEGGGSLYIVTGSACTEEQLRQILSRYGTITAVHDGKDVYEVSFDADKAKLNSPYTAQTLTTPTDPSFVAANLYDIQSPDSKRIARAAQMLSDANVSVLRRDICSTILEVIRQPWSADADAYTQLARALAAYAQPGDKTAVNQCYRYFETMCAAGRSVAPDVMALLIREEPDRMVRPVTLLWAVNPVAWESTLSLLGERAEETVLERAKDLQQNAQIISLLRYLQRYGTARSYPVIERFLQHSDSVIRHAAKVTMTKIQNRVGEQGRAE